MIFKMEIQVVKEVYELIVNIMEIKKYNYILFLKECIYIYVSYMKMLMK